MPHPLASLLGPLRYACQHHFAHLSTVKDLRGLLERALTAASLAKLDGPGVSALRAELEHVDSPSPEARQESLKRVLASLRACGLPLPPELDALAQKNVETEAIDATADERVPAAKKRASEAADGERPTEAERRVVLSIAPREGPLATPLKAVGWRVNGRLLGQLTKKGMRKVGDVLFMLPRVYEDRRQLRRIAQLLPGERGVTVGEVKKVEEVPFRRRKVFRAVVADGSGSIAATYFQTGPWLKAKFPVGRKVVLSGEVRASPYGREIPHPEVEPADDWGTSSVHFGRIVPVYPGFERHEQRAFRELAWRIAEKYAAAIEEPLPEPLRRKLGLLDLAEALRRIHFPRDTDDVDALSRHQSPAHKRLAFDELFFLQLGMALKRQGVKTQPGIAFDVSAERLSKAMALLPFQPTVAQLRVIKEICRDMGRPEPMNRLLQGDVGSGKTAVAVVAASIALESGYQVALMAPTEILAEQHCQTFRRLLGPAGHQVGLVTSGGTPKHKRKVREGIARGLLRVAIGTHALIEESVEFERLGLVVIDEQHRFGVIQRHALMAKGVRPDVLVMTATPIPRTLAMTLYGDLDVSLIDELPPGRTPIVTRVFVEKARPRVYEAMREQLERGHQCYVVYPLVEESEKVDLADATRGAKELQSLFPDRRVGLLHGRLKPEEKEQVMADFRARKIDILVCTTVVEVGVDVPNASVMVIEAAERFGLSQLHQLRGRVGRGAAKSYCFLIAGYARSHESTDRLEVMEQSSDGFVIAEKDLELRGPGEFLGTRQSGMPELAVANLSRDQALLVQARDEARAILEADPALKLPEHQGLVKALEERWEGRLRLARVG